MERVNILTMPSFVNAGGRSVYIIKDASKKYELDWSKTDEDLNVLFGFFSEDQPFDLLEFNSSSSANVTYVIGANTKLNYALAEINKSVSASRTFVVDINAEFSGGLAHFAKGDSKLDMTFNLVGTGAKALWRLATITKDNEKKSFNVSFNHESKNTYSKMENYGVALNNSSLVFAGVSHIKKGASSSSAHQVAKITLFNEKSIGKANPILRIDENEVSASHGATVGRVNEEHLFYLTSRGISKEGAIKILTLGYLNPILKVFETSEVGKHIEQLIGAV